MPGLRRSQMAAIPEWERSPALVTRRDVESMEESMPVIPEWGRSPALGTRHEVGSFGSMAGSTWSPSEPAREAEKTPREGSRFVDRLMPMAVHYGPWLSPAQGWGDMSIMPQGGLGGGSQPCCPCHVDTIRSGEKAEKTLRRGSRLVDRLAPMAVPYGPWWFGQLRAGAA